MILINHHHHQINPYLHPKKKKNYVGLGTPANPRTGHVSRWLVQLIPNSSDKHVSFVPTQLYKTERVEIRNNIIKKKYWEPVISSRELGISTQNLPRYNSQTTLTHPPKSQPHATSVYPYLYVAVSHGSLSLSLNLCFTPFTISSLSFSLLSFSL